MSLALMLMGAFRLSVNGEAVRISPSCQRLLACLAIHSSDLQRSYVAGTLWPEKTEKRALARLRHVVWEVRQTCDELFVSDYERLRMADKVYIDARQALRQSPNDLMGATLSGLSQETLQDRYGHDLLEHWDDEWVAPQRALLREWRLRSLEALSTQATADGDGGLAIQAALMVLEADPYRETAIRKVIDACLQDGNRALAVLHYGVFAERLYADIGVPPVNDLAAAIPGVSSSVIRRQLPARG